MSPLEIQPVKEHTGNISYLRPTSNMGFGKGDIANCRAVMDANYIKIKATEPALTVSLQVVDVCIESSGFSVGCLEVCEGYGTGIDVYELSNFTCKRGKRRWKGNPI